MYAIYLLISELRDKTYTGFTDDINQRIAAHKNKEVNSTKFFGNFSILFWKEVSLQQNRLGYVKNIGNLVLVEKN